MLGRTSAAKPIASTTLGMVTSRALGGGTTFTRELPTSCRNLGPLSNSGDAKLSSSFPQVAQSLSGTGGVWTNRACAKAIEAGAPNLYPCDRASPLSEDKSIPNTLAYLALYMWPAVCLVLFILLPVEAAAIWSLLGGYLLLPAAVSVDVHYLPPLDKFNVPALSTLLFCLMKGTQAPAPRRPL